MVGYVFDGHRVFHNDTQAALYFQERAREAYIVATSKGLLPYQVKHWQARAALAAKFAQLAVESIG